MPEESLEALQFLAAVATLNYVTADEIVALADRALMDGMYHDSLLSIIDAAPKTLPEVARHLQRYCADRHIPIGDAEWALRYLIRYFIRRMATPTSDPDHELVCLMHAVGPEKLRYLYDHGDNYGFDHLLFLGMQYNYFTQLQNVPEKELEDARKECIRLAGQMRDIAIDWLARCTGQDSTAEDHP